MSAIWTVTSDYFATGEGITYSAIITYAENETDAIRLFTEKFGEYFAIGCKASVGIVRNHVTEFLFSPALLNKLDKHKTDGMINVYGEYHLNLS